VSLRHIVDKRAAALAVACLAVSGASALAATSIQERFAACMACHGAAGGSTQPLTPSLAGQPSFYAITQLFLFRAGRRSNEAMTAQASAMSDDDLRAFSDLIGKLPPPPAPSANVIEPQRMARGAVLAQQHRCAACHGVDYAGGQQVARLAHQREDYLAKALTEFRSGKRLGYTSAMSEALVGIEPEALQDVAHYLANLPKAAP
jgi:cytochrome c553